MVRLAIRYRGTPTVSVLHIGRGSLERLGAFTRATTRARRAAVVADTNVAALYASKSLTSLRRAGIEATLITVPPGERSKTPRTLARLWEQLAELELERSDALVALGGGVVGDLAGFAAATWLRGVPWVGVPSSLLAQVDSSVGGKTGIDLRVGKNLVGAFHQPAAVLVDPEMLRTLPARQRRAGLAEVVKTGMAVDASLFRWLESNAPALAGGDPEALGGAVVRSIRAKAKVVQRDEREGGPRTALNFGHTLGHALEAATDYRGLLHGEAVAIGMRVTSDLSTRIAGLPVRDRVRLEVLLDAFGLPDRIPSVTVRDLFEAMRRDKKRRDRRVRWVLTPRIGHASVPRLISGRLIKIALLEAGARP